MTDLTDNLQKFYKNINNLKNQIEFMENSNRFALKYYLEQFEYKFTEFKSDDIIKDLPMLRKQKLNDLVLYQNKIKKLLAESEVSSSNTAINIPILKNNIANIYFKALYDIFKIPQVGKLLNIVNNQIIDKIFYPKYKISSANTYKSININPLEKLYYKQNFDSELLTNLLKKNDDLTISPLAYTIKDIIHFKNIVGPINDSNREIKINIFYSKLVNYIALNLYKNESLINQTNPNVVKKNLNIIFSEDSDYSKLCKSIYNQDTIRSTSNNLISISLNQYFKEKIINTNTTSDLLKSDTFLSGYFNDEGVKNIPLNKIYENRRNELIRSIPKEEHKRKLTKFVLSNYLSYTVKEIDINKDKILKKYDKFNSVFPSLKVLLNNITGIKYNLKTQNFEIYFSNLINYNKNFIYYNIKKIIDRINNFKKNNSSKKIIDFKKLYIIFSLELLRQINNNIDETILNEDPNTKHLHNLFSNYLNLMVDSAALDIKKYLTITENDESKNENINININSIDTSKFKNTGFIDNMILFTYQNLDRKQIKNDIKEHLISVFDFQKLFDNLFITINNHDLLAKLIKNKKFDFKYNQTVKNYTVNINELNEEEKNMLIDTHLDFIDNKYLNSLLEEKILFNSDINDYKNNIIDQKEIIVIIQQNKLKNLLNSIIVEMLNVDKIIDKFKNYVLFINNKFKLIYNFALNQNININNIYNINNNSDRNNKIHEIINTDKTLIMKIQQILLEFIKDYIFYKSYKKELNDDVDIKSYILEKILSAKINLNLNIKQINIINQQNYNID